MTVNIIVVPGFDDLPLVEYPLPTEVSPPPGSGPSRCVREGARDTIPSPRTNRARSSKSLIVRMCLKIPVVRVATDREFCYVR